MEEEVRVLRWPPQLLFLFPALQPKAEDSSAFYDEQAHTLTCHHRIMVRHLRSSVLCQSKRDNDAHSLHEAFGKALLQALDLKLFSVQKQLKNYSVSCCLSRIVGKDACITKLIVGDE